MVTFSADSPGTVPERWSTALDAAGLTPLEIAGHRRLVVIAAHPDDETLGAGGLLAHAAAAGLEIDVLVASDGEASHPGSPTHTPSDLAAIRRGEVAAAVGFVAPGALLERLHLPDGRLPDHLPELTDALRVVLDRGSRGPTLVVSPWLGDGHPDHWAAALATITAVAGRPEVTVRQYPVWLWHWGDPDGDDVPWDRLYALPLSGAALAAKQRALAAHVSQTTPLSAAPGDETLLPATLTAFFDAGTEYFLAPAAADTRPPPTPFPGVPDPSVFPGAPVPSASAGVPDPSTLPGVPDPTDPADRLGRTRASVGSSSRSSTATGRIPGRSRPAGTSSASATSRSRRSHDAGSGRRSSRAARSVC